MAKINSFIMEYRERIKENGVLAGESPATKNLVRGFVRLFREMDDSRIQGMINYPLEEVVLVAFLAVLGGASTWLEIVYFGKEKLRWLKKFLKFKNGIPSHDTYRRVFSLINTDQLQEITVTFLLANIYAIKKSLGIKEEGLRHICVDGKEQRGSGRNYEIPGLKKTNLQTLHVYDKTNGICLFSKAIAEKTNEIPVAQEILREMDLKGCIVTFDALHMQKDTLEAIRNAKGEYVGGLKGNQGALRKEAALYFDGECKKHYRKNGDFYETKEKARSKIEVRRYYLVRPHKSEVVKKWKGLKAFVCCDKTTEDTRNGKKTSETRYYAASMDDVVLCAEAIRGHWGVENELHWHLDVAFGEDDNSTMNKTAFNNLSLMNKMALSLCRLAKALKPGASIRTTRKAFGWNFEENLAALFMTYDEEALKEAMMECGKTLKGVKQS